MNKNTFLNRQLTPENVTELLFLYLVKGEKAADSISYVLGIPLYEIGSNDKELINAWRKLKPVYNWFGFAKL